MTRWEGLPARRRWHVRAVCCRRTGAPLVIKCIYLREGTRGPLSWHWSSKWPLVIVIHHHHGVGTEEKDEGRGKTKKTSWPFPPHTHRHTHSYTKHVHQLEGPFINTYVNTARYEAMLVTPTGSRHTTCSYSQKSTMNVKVKERSTVQMKCHRMTKTGCKKYGWVSNFFFPMAHISSHDMITTC